MLLQDILLKRLSNYVFKQKYTQKINFYRIQFQ